MRLLELPPIQWSWLLGPAPGVGLAALGGDVRRSVAAGGWVGACQAGTCQVTSVKLLQSSWLFRALVHCEMPACDHLVPCSKIPHAALEAHIMSECLYEQKVQ